MEEWAEERDGRYDGWKEGGREGWKTGGRQDKRYSKSKLLAVNPPLTIPLPSHFSPPPPHPLGPAL
jgi:hypothetical protein